MPTVLDGLESSGIDIGLRRHRPIGFQLEHSFPLFSESILKGLENLKDFRIGGNHGFRSTRLKGVAVNGGFQGSTPVQRLGATYRCWRQASVAISATGNVD